MDYGEKIAQLRKTHNMTQEELGKVLSVTYQAVSKWERGESLPDFNMMSRIAKFFEVPLSYFEEGGENIEQTANTEPTASEEATPAAAETNIIGTCTQCGKILKEDDEYESTPKLVCKSCAERLRQEEESKKQAEESRRRSIIENDARDQIGNGVDVKLIICLVLAVAVYVVLTVCCFTNASDRGLLAALLMIVPLAVFAIPYVIFDFIDDLRDRDDGAAGYKCVLSLIVGAAFSAVNIILFGIIYGTLERNGYYIGLMAIGAIVSFTFISQYMWGSVVRDIFTCGGFTFKLPGIIFSLTPESIVMMILIKIFLGILSIIVFVITTVLFAVVAILGSVFTFVPCIIYKTVKDRKARAELRQ